MRFFTLALMVSVLFLAGCNRTQGPYTVEKTWSNPVAEVKNCHQGKYTNECQVRVEGGQWVTRTMNNWPGGTIQKGDQLGTLYRVGDTWVETYRTRSTSDRMSYMGFCWKKDPDCTWPSKHQTL